MTYTKDVTIWCNFCSEWVQSDANEPSVPAVRKSVKQLGWRYVNGEDLCPTCHAIQEES